MPARRHGPTRPSPLLQSERGGRRTIVAAESYSQADRVVDMLAERGFPVDRLAIVAPGMRYRQRHRSRLDTVARVLAAAASAAVVSALAGSMLDLVDVVDARVSRPALALWSAGIGAVPGTITAIVLRLARTPPEAETGWILASRFEVVGDEPTASQAGRVLDASPWP